MSINATYLGMFVIAWFPLYMFLLHFFTKGKRKRAERLVVGVLLYLFLPVSFIYLVCLGLFTHKEELA